MTQKYNSLSFPVEKLRELYDYDYETGFLISRYGRWAGRPLKGTLNSIKGSWNVALYHEDGSPLRCNYGRVVFAWVNGRWPEGTIDHIDRDIRNNKIENLRDLSIQLQQNNTTYFNYGAHWSKVAKSWKAQIQINGKYIFLGYHKTQKAAQEAYMAECDRIGRKYLPATLVDDKYVPAERVMGIR